jgi:hypothetical protein
VRLKPSKNILPPTLVIIAKADDPVNADPSQQHDAGITGCPLSRA